MWIALVVFGMWKLCRFLLISNELRAKLLWSYTHELVKWTVMCVDSLMRMGCGKGKFYEHGFSSILGK